MKFLKFSLFVSLILLSAAAINAQTAISALPNGGLLQQTDTVPMVRSGVTMKAQPYIWPTNGSVMISTGNSAPSGISPINGRCLAGSGGAWTTTSCGTAGTVTSVSFTGDGILDSATPSSTVTSSGTVLATALTQSANTTLSGPTSGGSATPSFRSLVTADIPTGTSGSVIPLLNGTNTWGGVQTFSGTINSSTESASVFIPSGNSVPSNGMYLPFANILGFATNSSASNGMSLQSGKGLYIGTVSSVIGAGANGQGTLNTVSTGGNGGLNVANWSSSQGVLSFLNSTGSSIGTHGALGSSNLIGETDYYADDGTSYDRGVSIRASTEGSAPSSGAAPSKYSVYTYEAGANLSEAFRVDSHHHLGILSNIAPTVGTCGTGSPTVSGTDVKGVITTGTAATACTLTFGATWTAIPVCIAITSSTTALPSISAISTTSVTFTLAAALTGGQIYYHCLQ